MFNSTFNNAVLSTLAKAAAVTVALTSPSFAGEGGDGGGFPRDYILNSNGGFTSSEGGGMLQIGWAAERAEENKRRHQKDEPYSLESARKEGLAYTDR